MARRKSPEGCIALSDAVKQAAKEAFSGCADPQQEARTWLMREFRCGWQKPFVGCFKLGRGYWEAAARQTNSSRAIETGKFHAFQSEPGTSDPAGWVALDGNALYVDRQEFLVRLSVRQGGEPPELEQPIFGRDEENISLATAREIEARFTSAVPLSEVRKIYPEADEEMRGRAFSDPRIAAENRHSRYDAAHKREAAFWIEENPPNLPSARPHPSGATDPRGISVTLREAISWLAIGEALDWSDWIGAQTGLDHRETARRDQLFSIAEDELDKAVAAGRIVARHATRGDVGDVPHKIFHPPNTRDQAQLNFYENSIRTLDDEYLGVFFLTSDLVACWPSIDDPAVAPAAPPAPKTKRDTKELYGLHDAEVRDRTGRRPTAVEDDRWAVENGLRRERVREIRSHFRREGDSTGGAPKTKDNPAK